MHDGWPKLARIPAGSARKHQVPAQQDSKSALPSRYFGTLYLPSLSGRTISLMPAPEVAPTETPPVPAVVERGSNLSVFLLLPPPPGVNSDDTWVYEGLCGAVKETWIPSETGQGNHPNLGILA
jgi:hypothetical protein